jgi:hypothetical protein
MENLIKQKQISNTNFVGILLAKDWFNGMKYGSPFYDDYFVVCRWVDFHDGLKSNIEGKETIAICRKKKHVNLIFKKIKK